jgi:CBS domain-containing protein
MVTSVRSVAPTLPLDDLQDLLVEQRIGGVPVIEHDRVVGIVSRSDFVRAASLDRALAGVASEGFAADAEPGASVRTADARARVVRDIMSPDVVTVAPETPLDEVARVMAKRHLHRVVVIEDGTLRGMITALDLVRMIGDGRLRPPSD